MGTKLYVANLPYAPSAIALRAHFSACGVVSDVQIVGDRNAGRGRATAVVRMGSAAAAERALSELNGEPFAGQLLLVEAAPDDSPYEGGRSARRADPKDEAPVRITTQFREPANMTYELDCAGVALVLRIFFPTTEGQWRIAARTGNGADAPNSDATAPTRVEALREIARAGREGAVGALEYVDWDAVEQALTKVRAL
jgi:RNA recognition motif-containing protein